MHEGSEAFTVELDTPVGAVVNDSEATVEITDEFRGFRRMTLTPLVVNAARSRMVIASGTGKAPAVRRWLLRDRTIPIDKVRRKGTKAFFDPAAASELPG